MEKFLFTLIFIYSINPIFPTTHFEKSARYLHVYQDENQLNKPLVIKNTESDLAEVISQRFRRDLTSSDRSENVKNITTKVTKTQTTIFPPLINSEMRWKSLCVTSINYFGSSNSPESECNKSVLDFSLSFLLSLSLARLKRPKKSVRKKERWCMELVFVLLADGS